MRTTETASLKWRFGIGVGSVTLNVGGISAYFREEALMLLGQETDPFFIAVVLIGLGLGLFAAAVGPWARNRLVSWWYYDVDRFASLPEDVRRMRDGLRKAQRLSSYAGDGRLVYGVDDIDTVGELVSKLRPLGDGER